ncbi:hypothetical protein PAMP_009467 [Pampus punctatissimus]
MKENVIFDIQPSEPSRTKYMMTSAISSCDTPQHTYEDPDASVPALTDGSQSEVKVKPVPHPRSKLKPNAQFNNSNNNKTVVDGSSNATNSQNSEFPAHYKRPRPVRPAPRPPMTSSKPTAAVDGSNLHYMCSDTEPAVTSYIESRCSSISSMRQTLVSPALSEEPGYLFGTYNAMATVPDRPAVPPRASLPCSASVQKTSPSQTRPPPPTFNPPPPPSIRIPAESVYSEIEYPSYLELLIEDDHKMEQRKSTPRSERCYQNSFFSSYQQTTKDTEEINGMLRWLKIMSESDYMTPSLYGLSIEEEIRLFDRRAMNVMQALRLYNILMRKRKEILQNHISEFTSISDSLDNVQKKRKTMSIAGGTTGAVGGVTAVVGIALAPMTMGASLIATAVGAGMVASAGGMGAHAAKAKNKNVNRMTLEKLVNDYMANVVDIEHCLDFILSGMNELRRHDLIRLQRAGAQPDALKMAHLSQSVLRSNMNNGGRTSVAHTAGMSSQRLLQAFAKEMDQYFKVKDSQKLKQSTKSKFSDRVRLLAQNLQGELDHLNHMWEMFW